MDRWEQYFLCKNALRCGIFQESILDSQMKISILKIDYAEDEIRFHIWDKIVLQLQSNEHMGIEV
jgi:hypothetical protein